jgi:CpeT/CpcT family (DUF1001)
MGRAAALLAAAVAAAALAAGCAGQTKRAQADLVQLSARLPGYYDNQAQVRGDLAAGRSPHESLALAVVPVDAQLIGEHVYYLQEATGSRSRRVTMQRLVSFSASKSGILESQWSFTDPTRWLGADVTPELFTALQPQDVRPLQGCDLKWKRQGGRFTASDDPDDCRVVSSATGSVESIDMRVELGANELAISAQARGSPAPPGVDPYVRFRRNGGPP